tara:strand:- start:187 stop:732 length:546 start_codon:yes stop_codon:yes gene_type:complete
MGLSAFQSIGGVAVLIFLVALLGWLHYTRPRTQSFAPKKPSLGLGYEWTMTPLTKAKADLIAHFPELESVMQGRNGDGVQLIRFGLFNMTEEIIEPGQIIRPIKIYFSDDARLLSAMFSEALKTEPQINIVPTVENNVARLPQERMNPRSTLIYNFIVAGGTGPVDVTGETLGHGAIKRVG